MKILFVGFASHIHTARWLLQLKDTGFESYLFPSEGVVVNTHPEIKSNNTVTILDVVEPDMQNKVKYIELVSGINYRAERLAWYIKSIKPDIIHSMEYLLVVMVIF